MSEAKKDNQKETKFKPLNLIGNNQGMVCGPNGCSLAGHFDWAKDDKTKDKKEK